MHFLSIVVDSRISRGIIFPLITSLNYITINFYFKKDYSDSIFRYLYTNISSSENLLNGNLK